MPATRPAFRAIDASGVNMTAFGKTVTVAALAGLMAGLLLTAIQQIQVVPLIHKAEAYEQAAENANRAGGGNAAVEHEDGAWQPEDGWERNLFTAAANIVIAVGFALLLGAAVALRAAKLDWRSGLLWGLAGYAIFFVAPSLGLPPELPGTQAAELLHRQIWWLAASGLTATGLACLIFFRNRAIKAVGVVLPIVPHLFGAPQPAIHVSTAPAELVQSFIIASFMANAVFWLGLGGLFGFFHRKLAD